MAIFADCSVPALIIVDLPFRGRLEFVEATSVAFALGQSRAALVRERISWVPALAMLARPTAF